VEAVQDVKGGLDDAAAGQEVSEHMVAEQEHELVAMDSGNRFKAAVERS
jgi:hypothetical protein